MQGSIDVLQKYPVKNCKNWFVKFSCDFYFNQLAIGNNIYSGLCSDTKYLCKTMLCFLLFHIYHKLIKFLTSMMFTPAYITFCLENLLFTYTYFVFHKRNKNTYYSYIHFFKQATLKVKSICGKSSPAPLS